MNGWPDLKSLTSSLRWHYPDQVIGVAPLDRDLSAWMPKLPQSEYLTMASLENSSPRVNGRKSMPYNLGEPVTFIEMGRWLPSQKLASLTKIHLFLVFVTCYKERIKSCNTPLYKFDCGHICRCKIALFGNPKVARISPGHLSTFYPS